MAIVPSFAPFPQAITNAMVRNNGMWTPIGSPPNEYVKHDFAAGYLLTTRDTSLDISFVPSTSAGGFQAGFAVYVNNVFFQRVVPGGTVGVAQTVTVNFPGGLKNILIEEWQAYVTSIRSTAAPTVPAPLHSLDCWGDSIIDGVAANDFHLSWVVLLRHATGYYDNVTMDGIGGNALIAWSPSTYASHILARAVGSLTQEVYNEQGTNDYDNGGGVGTMTPAAWTTLMLACMDAALVAKPTLKFWQQTLLLRPGEEGVPNSLGATPEDYRIAQRAVASARPSVCTLIEGPPLCDATQIATPHPNNTGHAQIAARVMPLLNN